MSKENIVNILTKITSNKLIKSNVMIYGTGTIAKGVYEFLINRNYNIKCFLNKNFEYPDAVSNLEDIKKIDDDSITANMKNDFTVVVAIFNPYADVCNIIKNLRYLGYKNIITFAELIDIFEGEIEGIFYLNTSKNFIKDKSYIVKASDLWSDDKSGKLYESLVNFRITKDYKYLIDKDPLEQQYFPNDIENIYTEKNIRFVDCGAFDGDTIHSLISKFKNVQAIVAFEPDIENYKKLIEVINDIRSKHILEDISAFPCAVYSDAIQVKFDMKKSEGSNISDSGSNIVQCISIDDSIGGIKPTFIKMDIEGAEYEALLGAKKTICSIKPNLAISLYHTPSDLYRIPLLIDSWNLGYKFYLRIYRYSAHDLVMYAVK
ncbi:FkbM family methyltransferase [Clostridium sp. LBM24168]